MKASEWKYLAAFGVLLAAAAFLNAQIAWALVAAFVVVIFVKQYGAITKSLGGTTPA